MELVPETAHDELRTGKNSGRMWSKSLILLHFVSSGAVKTQNLRECVSGIGNDSAFDRASNLCCAQFQAIAQQAGEGQAHLLRTTEKI